jgi:phosphoglycolate phosphatase-like HAD superfamily hydrolase
VRGLVLDFDGVLFDSAPEAFLVARRTYAGVGPPVPADKPLSPPGDPWEMSRDEVLADPLYRRFVGHMPLGNRAEDYAAILSILERGVRVGDQEGYDGERERLSKEYAEAFHSHFYEVRTGFQDTHPQRWRALQGPYTPFVELLRRRWSDRTLAIATAKDRGSVRRLLDDNGLSDLFPDERLMDKETGRSKSAHLKRLHETLGLPFGDLTFVDDKVNHLDAVAPLGVRCVLAGWGYNGDREHDLARQRGYVVCSLRDAERILFEGDAP